MAYKQRWLGFFDATDSDRSQMIDLNDASIMAKRLACVLNKPDFSHEVMQAKAAYLTFTSEMIKACDMNKDGKVSREELLCSVEKLFIGMSPDSLPRWWNDYIMSCFTCVDADRNGVVSCEEKEAQIKRYNPIVSSSEVKQAYDWATKMSPSGKLDMEAYIRVAHVWATSPNPTPEASCLLPFLSPSLHTQTM